MKQFTYGMRVLLLFLLANFCWSDAAQGQDHASLMGGLNQNNFLLEMASNYENENLSLFFAGLSLEEDMGRSWKFNTFIQYCQKGGMLQVPSTSFLDRSSIRLQYIDVVPSLEYKVTDFLGIYGGGVVGYLIRADQKLQNEYVKVTEPFFEDLNFGLVLGIKLYVGNSGFNLHWDRGIKNIISESDNIPAQGFKLYNQSFQLGFTLYL